MTNVLWPVNGYNRGPISQVQPFVYSDAVSVLDILKLLRKYIIEEIVPALNNLSEEVDAAIAEMLAAVDTAIENNQTWVTEQVNQLTQYVNDQVQLIIDDSIEVQDPVMAGIMADDDSATRSVTDAVYADKATQTTVETGRLSETELDANYADKATQTTVETGRLSSDSLNDVYTVYRDWDGSAYPARIPGAKNIFYGIADPGSAMAGNDVWISPLNTAPPLSSIVTRAWMLSERWTPAVERVRSGAGHANVLCIGDSTTWGTGSSAAISPMESYPHRMAQRMVSLVAPTVYGFAIPPSDNRPDSDSRWQLGTGWARSTDTGVGLGGRHSAYKGGPNSGPLNFTPNHNVAFTSYDIYYTQNASASAAGTFTAECGGEIITQNTFGTPNGIGKVTVTGPASTTRGVSIATTDDPGNVWILGITPHDGSSRIRVGNAGVAASGSASWVQGRTNEGDAWNVFAFLPVFEPDLTIIDLGINDAPGTDPATYAARIRRIADAAYDAGSAVLLKTMIPSQGERGEVEKLYINELKGMPYPLLDIYANYGSWERANSMGLMADWGHGNSAMYQDEGRIVAEFLAQYA